MAGVVAYVLWSRWSRKPNVIPFKQLKRELEAITAGVEVEKVRAELGHQEAIKHIDDKYRLAIERMDDAQAEEASWLRDDPEALTRFIIRGRS